jgi:hypothetical protein
VLFCWLCLSLASDWWSDIIPKWPFLCFWVIQKDTVNIHDYLLNKRKKVSANCRYVIMLNAVRWLLWRPGFGQGRYVLVWPHPMWVFRDEIYWRSFCRFTNIHQRITTFERLCSFPDSRLSGKKYTVLKLFWHNMHTRVTPLCNCQSRQCTNRLITNPFVRFVSASHTPMVYKIGTILVNMCPSFVYCQDIWIISASPLLTSKRFLTQKLFHCNVLSLKYFNWNVQGQML